MIDVSSQPTYLTERVEPQAGSALDPMVEEVTWTGWDLVAANPNAISGNAIEVINLRMRRLAETNWSPGAGVIISEIEIIPNPNGRPSTKIRLAVGRLGPTGTTHCEVEGLRSALHWLKDDDTPYSVVPGDMRSLFDRPDTRDWHNFIIRQPVETVQTPDGHGIEIVRRFNPMPAAWTQIVHILADYGRPIRFRATILATEFSTFDKIEIGRDIADLASARDDVRADEQVLLERAQATMFDLQASFASPLCIGEYAVTSVERLPDTITRAVGTRITSGSDTVHSPHGTIVAGNHLMLGGFDIEREVEGLYLAHHLGLPLRGGLTGRQTRDLMTLTECPIGLPVPAGRALPGVPVRMGEVYAEERLRVDDPIDSIGTTERGVAVGLSSELRTRHTLVVGTPGSGKSTYVSHRAVAALHQQRPMLLLDPHGSLAEHIRGHATALRRPIHYIAPTDPDTDVFCPIEALSPSGYNHELVAAQIRRMAVAFGTAFDDASWHGPRGVSIIDALLWVLVAHEWDYLHAVNWFADGGSMDELGHPEIPKIAKNTLKVLMGRGASSDAGEIRQWVTSKMYSVVSGAASNVFAAPGRAFSLKELVDDGIPLLINLRGLSTDARRMVGHQITDTVLNHLMRTSNDSGRLFEAFIDEAHAFPSNGLISALAEGRKFGIGVTLVTQSIGQFPSQLADLAMSCNTNVIFRPTIDTLARLSLHRSIDPDEMRRLRDLQAIVALGDEDPIRIDIPPYRQPGDL